MKILLKWKKWQIKFYRCPIGDVSVWDILRDFGDGLEKNWGQTREKLGTDSKSLKMSQTETSPIGQNKGW